MWLGGTRIVVCYQDPFGGGDEVYPSEPCEEETMSRSRWVAGLIATAMLTALVGDALGREPTQRTSGQKSSGSRSDATVPYLTTGDSAFMGNSVGPKIYKSPIVDDPKNPGAKPVYNLIFYGAVQSFGDKSNGATPKPR